MFVDSGFMVIHFCDYVVFKCIYGAFPFTALIGPYGWFRVISLTQKTKPCKRGNERHGL